MSNCNNTIKENLRKFYDQTADLRDSSEKQDWKIKERQSFLDLSKSEGKQTLLELGAGTGNDSLFFRENGLTVTAIDLSAEMVKRCKEKSVDAYELDYYQVSMLNKKFQCIWSMNSLLHVPKAELPQVLTSIDSVLDENGLFFMGVYGGENRENEYMNEVSEHPRFFSYYTKDMLAAVLEQHFTIIMLHEYDVGRNINFQSALMRKKESVGV